MLLAALVLLAGCDVKDRFPVSLNGDVWVTSLSLDGYDAVIDNSAKTIKVSVSNSYDASAMEITALTMSEGATASMKVGEKLNMNVPQVLRVVNGNVYLDYTIYVVHDSASILSVKINGEYNGIIKDNEGTITVRVPEDLDLSALTITYTLSSGAECSVPQGSVLDFTDPVTLTVTFNTASKSYVVTVLPMGKPKALFVGLATTIDGLSYEEKAAAEWMLANVDAAQYASFEDISLSNVDLSECEVIWWHFHLDSGIGNLDQLKTAAPAAETALGRLKEYYNAGGHFLLTRYATFYAARLGAVKNDAVPNNCWGNKETEAETVTGPWDFRITGNENHAIYQNLVRQAGETQKIFMFDAGYRVTNTTCQWHIGSDWGGYADLDTWRTLTGGVDLAHGGDGAVVIWEFPSSGTKGNVFCIGTGLYDWYAHDVDTSSDQYHVNVARLTENIINYINQ